MNTVLKADWLPGGELELKPIPLKGDRELKELVLKDAEVDSLFTQQKYLKLAAAIMAAERISKTLGKEKAHESWNDFILLEFGGLRDLLWPLEKFEENLAANKARLINQQLGAANDEEASARIQEMAEEVRKKAASLDDATVARIVQRPLIALYWRLRASGVTSILTPEGPKTIDWSLDPKKRTEALDLLGEVVTAEQLRALDERPRSRPLDLEELLPHTAAEVEGKSVTPSTPTGASSPSSTPSSASLGALPAA